MSRRECRFAGGPLDGQTFQASDSHDRYQGPFPIKVDISTLGEETEPRKIERMAIYQRDKADPTLFRCLNPEDADAC